MVWSKPVFITLGLLVVLALIARVFLIDVLWIQTQRFEPLLKKGDVVMGLRTVPAGVGDFVSHSCSTHRDCLSQVIAQEGDRVDFQNRQVKVNDQEFISSFNPGFFAPADALPPEPTSWVVPPRSYFVLGDGMGLLTPDQVNSVFTRVLLSVDGSAARMRWSRIGQRIH